MACRKPARPPPLAAGPPAVLRPDLTVVISACLQSLIVGAPGSKLPVSRRLDLSSPALCNTPDGDVDQPMGGFVRLKFQPYFNRLLVVENRRFSVRFIRCPESQIQPDWR